MMTRYYAVIIVTILRGATCTAHNYQEQQYCPAVDFPIPTTSDTEICRPESLGKSSRPTTVDMTSFVQYPTPGQRLILVPRASDLTILLNDHVAYQLRQRQQLHNTKSDDFMDVPLQMNGYKVVSHLAGETILQYESNHTIDMIFTKKEMVPLLLKSHPGQALVPLQPDPMGGGFMMEQLDYVDVGIGPESAAIPIRLREPEVLTRKGNTNDDSLRYALVNADGLVFIVGSSQLKVGSPVTMTSWLNDDGSDDINVTLSQFVTKFHYRCPFVVNTDGSLSPLEAPHLAIGISRFPEVTLMKRFSANRLLVKDVATFWNAPAPVNGTPLVLNSHPGLAVVEYARYRGAFGLAYMMDVSIGPANNDTYRTLHLFSRDAVRHHEFSLRDRYGAYLVPMNMNLQIGTPLRLIRYNVSESEFASTALSILIYIRPIARWIINLDGSISPLNAPHLVLGCRHVSQFVDRDFATKQRLIWQSNAIVDDKKDKGVAPATSVGDEERLFHFLIWFLIVEDYFGYVVLILAVAIVVVIKLFPLSIWVMLLLQLTLGTVACSFYVGFKMGSLVTTAIFKRFKKNNVPAGVHVR